MSSIEEQVKSIVAEQLGVKEDEVTNDASFVDDLGADSLDTVELPTKTRKKSPLFSRQLISSILARRAIDAGGAAVCAAPCFLPRQLCHYPGI